MRLFVGLQPSPEFRNALVELQDRLRSAGITGQYLEPVNLHMTLAFIGMWPEDISALLPNVRKPFSISLSHAGCFPQADVIWAGVAPSPALDCLAQRVRNILSEAGIPFDRKRFNPHITLIRKFSVHNGIALSEITVPHAIMTVRDVCLYRSDRGENGMAYTVIGRSLK